MESKRSTIGRGALKPRQKLRRKWVALRENYFDVWRLQNIRANRITNAQWLGPYPIAFSIFDTPPKKRGKIKQNVRCVCMRAWRACANRVRSCGGNVGGMRNKNIPAFDLLQIFFAQYKKGCERKRNSLISEIVIAWIALLCISLLFYFTRDERKNPLLDWGFKAEARQTGNNIYDGEI